jgi:hypothetical protein
MIKIAHIVNQVNVNKSSDLFEAQPVTFRTMLAAKKFCAQEGVVNLYAVGYEEDRAIIPNGFEALPNLLKSVMDFGRFNNFRKLPLIGEILDSCRNLDVDYIIYANVDIALQPYFYNYILEKIQNGSDSLIINRRIIDTISSDVMMYSKVGQKHPGYDCFVFKKDLLNKFEFGNVCIGANWIGRIFYSNLLILSNSLEVVEDAHLTFHIGEDGAWVQEKFSEFDLHNEEEVKRIIKKQLIKYKDNKEFVIKLNKVLSQINDWGKSNVLKDLTKDKKNRLKIPFKVKQFIKLFFK